MENISPIDPWQVPQRQSPAAIFIMIWSTAINLLKGFWPVLAIYFFRGEKDESLNFLWALVGFGVLSIVGAVVGYWFKKFHITNDTLVIQSGWLKKKTLSIPVHTIQAVHLEQNLWQQAFGVAKVSLDSVGSDEVEAKLDALVMGKAEQLRELLMEKKAMNAPDPREAVQENAPPTHSLSFSDLIKLSLTANHLEAFFILAALLINILDEVKQIFGGNDYLDNYGRNLLGQTMFALTFLLMAVVVVSMFFSMARTMIKYYGFQLWDADRRWIISYGLFDKTKKIVPLNKIQILSWKANWLRRKIDYWTIQVQSVGHKEHKKSNIHVPVVSFESVIQLVAGYQHYEVFQVEKSLKIDPAYWKRSASQRSLIITLIPTVILHYWFGWQALPVLLLYPFLVWGDFQWYRNFRWQPSTTGIQILSGVFGRKFTLLNWKKIQQVHLYQSLYQRNRGLATVVFVTAGGKLSLPYISLSTATHLVDQVLYEVESKVESWM
jgi:putative membrane protein